MTGPYYYKRTEDILGGRGPQAGALRHVFSYNRRGYSPE